MYIVLWKHPGEKKWRLDGVKIRENFDMASQDMEAHRHNGVEYKLFGLRPLI